MLVKQKLRGIISFHLFCSVIVEAFILRQSCLRTSEEIEVDSDCEKNVLYKKKCVESEKSSVCSLSSCRRYQLVIVALQLPQELMSQPEKSDKPSDKKQKARRHLSGGEDLLRGFLMVQESCAEIGNMATPRRYMTFLHCYRQLYKLKKEGIEQKQQHLQVEADASSIR